MELKRVVITGLGALTPVGNTVAETWQSLINGVSGAGLITSFDTTLFKTKFACEVKGFNVSQFLDRKEARKMDRYAQMGVVAAAEAIADAGLNDPSIDKDRVGVIFSSGIGGLNTMDQEVGYYYQHVDIGPKFNPFFIPKLIGDIAAGHISIIHGFRGPNYGTVSACASSTTGAICAFDLIRMGKADAVVTGGSESPITPTGVGGFNSMNALSTRNDSPQTASRPFSASRDGFVMGEGAVCLIFEELEHARARGAHIYAEVIGGGASGDAYHLTASHPDGLGAILVMENALKDAGISANQVDYINVHGTSTPVGDPSEVKAITKVFGDHTYRMNISSTKSMTGHMLGAAGAVEAMICTLAVKNGIVPPTINHEDGDNDPDIDYRINFTFNRAQKRDVNIALSNTFGFGGHNACIIVRKFNE
jgi:3-oxoacyl-[acyl-carrier-protein] synthase II